MWWVCGQCGHLPPGPWGILCVVWACTKSLTSFSWLSPNTRRDEGFDRSQSKLLSLVL